jgi:hypothetical protein
VGGRLLIALAPVTGDSVSVDFPGGERWGRIRIETKRKGSS